MRKIIVLFLLIISIALAFESCNRHRNDDDCETITPDVSNEQNAPTFFGDSTLTIISSNRPNGYLVKFFQTKDLTLINLSRGDSINQYVALHEIPRSVWMESCYDLTFGDEPMAIGTYIREINIPVEKELGMGLFFMDVNFDGEEELDTVIKSKFFGGKIDQFWKSPQITSIFALFTLNFKVCQRR